MIFGLGLCFFLAATNTLSGWLYVLSALMLGVSVTGFYLPGRQLRALQLERLQPVVSLHVGETCTLSLQIVNGSAARLHGLIAIDRRPEALGGKVEQALDGFKAHENRSWQSTLAPMRRGVYHWENVALQSAAPLGLIWSSRVYACPTTVVAYPRLFKLERCPLIEDLTSQGRPETARHFARSTEGITCTVRPYRQGDSLKAVHWRSSARRGALQTREFEQERTIAAVVIAVDCRADYWTEASFECAVESALALYDFARESDCLAVVWTGSERLTERTRVLDYLARLMPDPAAPAPQSALAATLWLSAHPQPPTEGCDWIWVGTGSSSTARKSIDPLLPLVEQLEVLR